MSEPRLSLNTVLKAKPNQWETDFPRKSADICLSCGVHAVQIELADINDLTDQDM